MSGKHVEGRGEGNLCQERRLFGLYLRRSHWIGGHGGFPEMPVSLSGVGVEDDTRSKNMGDLYRVEDDDHDDDDGNRKIYSWGVRLGSAGCI